MVVIVIKEGRAAWTLATAHAPPVAGKQTGPVAVGILPRPLNSCSRSCFAHNRVFLLGVREDSGRLKGMV